MAEKNIDTLLADPKFRRLMQINPDKAKSIVLDMRQAHFGKPPKPEGFLQRAMQKSRGFTEGFADVTTLGGTALARNLANKMVPLSPEAESKYQENFKVDPQAKMAGALTAGVGGGINLAGKGIASLFSKQFAKKALPKATGKLTSSIQEVIKRSKAGNVGVPKNEVQKMLEKGLASSQNQKGAQASLFKNWINIVKKKKGKMLDADTIEEIETQFGRAAKFGKRDPSGNPRLIQAAKDVNRYASSKFDELASQTGVKEFAKSSAEKSKILKSISAKPSFMGKVGKEAVLTGARVLGGTLGYKAAKSIFD